MNNKQARSAGRVLFVCGFVFIILGQVFIGLALIAVGLVLMTVLGRCPNCGKFLTMLSSKATHCPYCKKPL